MLKPFQMINTALPYLKDKEVRTAFDKFLRQLDRDADDVGFEVSTATDFALRDLEEAINNVDDADKKDGVEADFGEDDDEG